MKFLTTLLALFAVSATAASKPPVSSYTVVATYPHSTGDYTEGLFFLDGLFYESTGLTGRSQIIAYKPDGTAVRTQFFPPQLFGEGIVDWGPNLYAWTWQSHIGYVYDRATFHLLSQFTYTGEGWGMTRNSKELITSDGTATLRFRSPVNFAETHNIVVTDDGQPVQMLNELEWVKGEIYANVWHTDRIARISPKTGKVVGWIDLTGLLSVMQRPSDPEAVLNGIAYEARQNRLFVTGKEWPLIFEIKVTHKHK